jgi:acyl-homoserine lactone acylase PvdQ
MARWSPIATASTVAMRVAAIDRPRLFEQFWRMGLRRNLAEWKDAMRMQQLPLFNTAYADRDGHIGYVYNATLPVHATGDYRYWQGIVPGDRSDLVSSTIVPFDQIPQVFDPPTGWVQNSNDMPWTSVYPMVLDPTKFAAGFAAPQGITQRAQRGIRILSGFTGKKMTFADVKAGKLSTRVETADQFVDDLVATARKIGTDRAKRAADVLATWDRQSENTSDGTLLFYKFMTEAGNSFTNIGGFAVPGDDRQPLTTPRGFRRCGTRRRRTRQGRRRRGKGIRAAQRAVGRGTALTPRQTLIYRQRRAVAAGRDSHRWRQPVQGRQGRRRPGRHVLRRDRILHADPCRRPAQLRQLVEEGLAARRRPNQADVAQGNATDLARSKRRRGAPRSEEDFLS